MYFYPMKLHHLLTRYQDKLSHLYDHDESQQIFLLVLQHLMNYKRSDFILRKNESADEQLLLKFNKILEELKSAKPVQYVLGKADFYGLTFKVNPSVLIPRPETEELVDWILREVDVNKVVKILDVGTGSGCIAIALAKHLPQANIVAIDIAEDSLQTARVNALMNEVKVEFIHESILAISQLSNMKFEVIVSNPPYITQDEKEQMHQNVLAHEPHRALFVENSNPLLFYQAISDYAFEHLLPNGKLFFEINEYFAEETQMILKEKGFQTVRLEKDMQGKNRMVIAEKI